MLLIENIEAWIKPLVNADSLWIVQVFSLVFLTLLVNFIAVKLMPRFVRQFSKTKTIWDDVLFLAVSKPLSYLIWVIGFSAAFTVVLTQSESSLIEYVAPVRHVCIIALITWATVRFLSMAEQNLVELEKSSFDHTTVRAVTRLLRLAAMITGALVMLESLGFSIKGVLAFGGIGGIAVGFAAKDLLANFFGGLMIYLDRPFTVGDWIRSPDREIEGTVEDIGWRLTRIRTFDKRPLYIPNSTFTSIAVENPSRMNNRRIYETIGVRYDDASHVANIIEDIRKMLTEHDEIDQKQTLIVNLNRFGPSSLDFFIYTFTKTTDWVYFHQVKERVMLGILAIVESYGAQIAFPTTTLDLPAGLLANEALAVSEKPNT